MLATANQFPKFAPIDVNALAYAPTGQKSLHYCQQSAYLLGKVCSSSDKAVNPQCTIKSTHFAGSAPENSETAKPLEHTDTRSRPSEAITIEWRQ